MPKRKAKPKAKVDTGILAVYKQDGNHWYGVCQHCGYQSPTAILAATQGDMRRHIADNAACQ